MAVATNTLKPQLLVLSKGEYVFEEGDDAVFAYVLTEGVIEIVATSKGEEHVLGKLEKGTIFGEMAIIDGFPRSASARAAADCKVQEVGHKEFLNYISKKPDAAFSIMTRLSGFVRSADKKASESFLLRKTGTNEEEKDQKNDQTDIVAVHNFEDTESIYSRPPSKPVIITAAGLLIFTLCIVLWASFSFVDKTVSARGKFTNTAPNIEIQSTGSSIIEELNLERGQFVKKGEIVAILDGTVVNANLKITRDKIYAVKNKILRLELQKNSILKKSLNKGSSGQLDPINEEILNRHFDEFMIKMKTFSSDLLLLETEIVSMSADKELIRDQLDIKIKIEEGKKKLFEKNVGSLMDTLSSTDQRISVKRQLLSQPEVSKNSNHKKHQLLTRDPLI